MKAPERATSRTAETRQLFEGLEHGRQPGLQKRAFDLHDIPVQNEKRDLADAVEREECHGRRIIVGASLRRGVDDREDASHLVGSGSG